MNDGSEFRLTTCVIHFFVYLVAVVVPWLFVFEMLPFNYAAMTIPVEVGIYILWSIVLILSAILTKKDIKKYTFDSTGETVSKRMWKVIFVIFRILMLFTLAYLLLSLLLIGISYMV
ncbi:hypothetical protein Ana3638_00565 [Anaerocolumna sedimenticola]|uniref:Uncharacterized protein n=1 Tax=Anaerocolumna sedimenticola TaxID=2696063 RepID=A0A6P1TE84_9FIRM|nr:hypothetical protein [Anaerocolumna sedimenticola]QHQ59474.1 hypothetical protein Ana3638_00565 [Anaerocolumna sedimenticola]